MTNYLIEDCVECQEIGHMNPGEVFYLYGDVYVRIYPTFFSALPPALRAQDDEPQLCNVVRLKSGEVLHLDDYMEVEVVKEVVVKRSTGGIEHDIT